MGSRVTVYSRFYEVASTRGQRRVLDITAQGHNEAPAGAPEMLIQHSDTAWRYQLGDTVVDALPARVAPSGSLHALSSPFFFLLPDSSQGFQEWVADLKQDPLSRSVNLLGAERWKGEMCHVIEWITEHDWSIPSDTLVWTVKLYVGIADSVIHRVVKTNTRGARTEQELLTLDVNRPIPPETFARPPAKLARRWPFVKRSTRVGKKMPELVTPRSFRTAFDSSAVRLADLLEGSRGLVIWPWMYG